MKSYRYKFQLESQALVGGQTAGNMNVPNPPGGSSSAPLFGDTTAGGARSMNILPGSVGTAPGYYDMVGAVSFRATDLQKWGAFQAMYDAYKINKITLNVEFLANTASTVGIGLLPTLYLYWDQDDDNIPTSIAQLTSKQGVIRRQIGNKMKSNYTFSFRPTVSTGLAQPGSILGATVTKAPFINSVASTIPHYGLKFAIQDLYLPGTATAQQTAIRWHWTYDISFRAPLLTN